MNILINSNTGVVVAATMNKPEKVSNGILVDGVIYGQRDLNIIEDVDLQVLPFKNTLINGVVGINPEWESSNSKAVQDAIDNYTLELLDGGLL